MKKTRFLSALLAALMLVAPLASCANGDDPVETGDKATNDTGSEEDTGVHDDLPSSLDYDKAKITIISRDLEGWTRGEISVDGITSEPVNDAIFERNRMVESRLNITFNSILDPDAGSGTVPSKVARAVKAGTNEYDIMAACAYTTAPESLKGTFANLLNTEYLDFGKPYWTQGYNEAMEYDGMQFSATGSMLLSIYRFAFVTVFNKDLFTNANQPFLYDTVEEGAWTLDKQISLVPLFHKDNGNGIQDETGDTYGFISSRLISTDAYWSSCQVDIVTKNTDGELVLVFDSGKLYDVAEKVLQLYYGTDDGTYSMPSKTGDAEQADIRKMFSNNLGAMATLRIMELENSEMRNMESEYGVIPMPKFDEKQDGYYTLLHDQFTVVAVPTTVKGERLDMVSAVLEAMSSVSYKIVKPAYYEETLRTKIAKDPQSAQMMDIITEGIFIDAGIIYTDAFDSFQNGLRDIVGNKNNDAISRFKTKLVIAEKGLKRKIVGMFDKIASQQPQ